MGPIPTTDILISDFKDATGCTITVGDRKIGGTGPLLMAAGVMESQAAEIADLRKALQNLLDVFHQGQVTVRPEAEGYVASVIEAGELLLKGD